MSITAAITIKAIAITLMKLSAGKLSLTNKALNIE